MSIRQVLQAQLTQNPAAIAIKYADEELTYQQLNSRANRLANYLCKQGVGAEVLVGIYAERSIDFAVAILGILQAGGVYVPLDPAYPRSRLVSILTETNPPIILTQSHLATDLNTTGIDLFLLDTLDLELAHESEQLSSVSIGTDNLAYIMYTSGSTGKPQGVQVTRGQVECYLQALAKIVKVGPDDVYLHSASFSFSSSIRQLLLPLARGAKVVITSKENTSNLGSLLELIQVENITVFDTVSSVWHYLLLSVDDGMAGSPRSLLINCQLRLLIFSGGLLTAQLLDRVRNQFQQSPQIINIYGQTETIGVCAYPIPADFDRQEGYVPVGYPYAHNQIYIVDENFRQVVVGKIGELCVAGESLARGYLNNLQLNERKFTIDPFITNYQQRLYKTGDLARYLPDGNLEIVGRQDFQVKIRGMRVEVEEIETVLMQHPEVRQAAVVGRVDFAGEQTIVAYIVADRSQLKLHDLRSFLQTKLTDYMMPSVFEILDTLPLTPNQKLDRNRLPAPSRSSFEIVPAHDELELQLIKIWEKVLGIQPIGTSDNFFELGGHSLIALQLFAEIEQIWHQRFLLATLFESPTIAELADRIRTVENPHDWSPLVEIEAGGDRLPLFCIHPIGGNLFSYYNLAKNMGGDRPIYGLQALGVDGQSEPLDRIEDMANYFIRSIQTIQPHGPYFLLGYSFGGIIAFEMARQLVGDGEEVALLGLLDIRCPTLEKFNLPFFQWLNLHWHKLSQLKFSQKIEYLINRIFFDKTTAYRDEVVTTLSNLEMFTPEVLKVLDCNLKARQNYRPQTYPGQATLFWSEYQSLYIERYPELGWGTLVTGGLEIYPLPGNHLTIVKEPHVRVLAEKLKLCMDSGG
jgi:amino acid adenylation domain-containing protein